MKGETLLPLQKRVRECEKTRAVHCACAVASHAPNAEGGRWGDIGVVFKRRRVIMSEVVKRRWANVGMAVKKRWANVGMVVKRRWANVGLV